MRCDRCRHEARSARRCYRLNPVNFRPRRLLLCAGCREALGYTAETFKRRLSASLVLGHHRTPHGTH